MHCVFDRHQVSPLRTQTKLLCALLLEPLGQFSDERNPSTWRRHSRNGRTVRSPQNLPNPRARVLVFFSHALFSPTEKLFIVTADGRTIVGTLLGNDQVQNLILNDAVERVHSADADVEEVPLGLYVIRGDNLCLVGEYDETKLNDAERVPQPLKPVLQHVYF